MVNFKLYDSLGIRYLSPVKEWAFWKKSSVALVLTSLAFTGTVTAQQQTDLAPKGGPTVNLFGKLDFGAIQVPEVKGSLPIIRFNSQAAPAGFVRESLNKMGANPSKIGPLAKSPEFANSDKHIPESVMGLMDNGHLRAYWDENSGDAEIFPFFEEQKTVVVADPAALSADRHSTETSDALKQKLNLATTSAQQIFARPDILPHDATQFTIGTPRPVMGASASREAGTENVKDSGSTLYLTYVPVMRKVEGYPVYGEGSRALVAIGNDGSVQGFSRHWKTGAVNGGVQETRTAEQVRSEIVKQLQPLAALANVSVLSVDLAYYDNNVDSIQPVYRITAKVHYLPGSVGGVKPAKQLGDDDFIVRYLPVGALREAAAPELILPSSFDAPRAPVTIPPDDPTVGRYVVRNDDSGWVASANGFWNNISGFPNGGFFTNLQYYWAYPFEFNSYEQSYTNSVNVSLTEAHGDWWFFTTYQNWGDGVDITAIPANEGYGPANGGQLAYWALHTCEVVPSYVDAPCSTDSRSWWTPWFNVFKGLHTVVGYRTIMYINDGTTSPFGSSLEWGAPVISAWFNATNGALDYFFRPTSTAHCGKSLPMGRPSVVTVCGHENDNIYNQAAIPAASCLHNLYQPD